MEFLHALILGATEGVTEFLPISSTGHLVLVSSLLLIPQSDFQKSFEIIIQLGAILAVVALYWRSFLQTDTLKKLLVAFIPTGIIGLALYKIIKTYLLGNIFVILGALFLGGIAILIFEYFHQEKEDAVSDISHLSYTQAALVGLFQAFAIIPGISRSGATILGGLFLGMRRATITQFSFLLAVPTMMAATGLDLVKNISTFSLSNIGVLVIGFVSAFAVALFSIKVFLGFVRTHTFVPFGIYRIIIATLFFFIVF